MKLDDRRDIEASDQLKELIIGAAKYSDYSVTAPPLHIHPNRAAPPSQDNNATHTHTHTHKYRTTTITHTHTTMHIIQNPHTTMTRITHNNETSHTHTQQ